MRARAERKSLDRVIDSLARSFPAVRRTTIERIVDRRYLEFYDAPVRDYICLLVEREVKEDLRACLGVGTLHSRQEPAAPHA